MFESPAKGPCSCALLLLVCVAVPQSVYGQPEPLDPSVLDSWKAHSNAGNSLYRHLYTQASSLLQQRHDRVASVRTGQEWVRRQEWIGNTLLKMWGPFPQGTPLNPRVTGVLYQDGYRIEKLVYESQPRFYVTAALFIPDGLEGAVPAIIYCSGHSEDAFRSPVYQRVILNLVKKHFVVLAFDPISQGERLQYYDPEIDESRVGPTTREHNYAGGQSYLVGVPVARTMIWDGMRAVDYLLTRPEVDPRRIGITGRSGGGTQSSFIASVDDRILAAAPENYMTTTHRLLESIGPQDAEQIFPAGLARGFDFADLLSVRAPRPSLALATTRDYFSIQGFTEMYEEVGRAYTALGAPHSVGVSIDDAPHQSTRKNREALYGFFQEALSHPGTPFEEEVDRLPREDLLVTSTGQVADSLGGKTVFDLLGPHTQRAIDALQEARRTQVGTDSQHFQNRARVLSGYVPPRPDDSVWTGRSQFDGYTLEKHFLAGPDYPLPFLLFLPEGPGPHPAVVYLDDRGKSAGSRPGGVVPGLVEQGFAVLAADLAGIGELGPSQARASGTGVRVQSGDYTLWYLATLLDRSLVGVRAADIVRLGRFLQARGEIGSQKISFIAQGSTTATALLHAAAFENAIGRVALIQPLVSYQSLASSRYYDPTLIGDTVPGALPEYDLADLMAGLAPRHLLVIDPVDAMRRPVPLTSLQTTYAGVRDSFQQKGFQERLRVLRLGPEGSAYNLLLQWLQDDW